MVVSVLVEDVKCGQLRILPELDVFVMELVTMALYQLMIQCVGLHFLVIGLLEKTLDSGWFWEDCYSTALRVGKFCKLLSLLLPPVPRLFYLQSGHSMTYFRHRSPPWSASVKGEVQEAEFANGRTIKTIVDRKKAWNDIKGIARVWASARQDQNWVYNFARQDQQRVKWFKSLVGIKN